MVTSFKSISKHLNYDFFDISILFGKSNIDPKPTLKYPGGGSSPGCSSNTVGSVGLALDTTV